MFDAKKRRRGTNPEGRRQVSLSLKWAKGRKRKKGERLVQKPG